MDIINNQLKTLLLSGHSTSEKRAELKRYFINTWQTYDALFSLINDDSAYYLRPEVLRHPLIFYFGHTATFYINKLILGKFISKRVNAKLEAICAVGVDEMSWDDLNSEHYDWPSVDEVRLYRQQIASLIENLIDNMSLSLPIRNDSLAWIILMGCEHERIHLETSSVIMRMLPVEYLTPAPAWSTCQQIGAAPDNQLLVVQGKNVEMGKPASADTFGWDNEYGEAQIQVDDFKSSKYLVSNQEFLAFIKDGGYQENKYWTQEGQQWLNFKKPTMPRFWFIKAQQYFQRNLLNEIPLPMNWPAEVNYLEAKAFCLWKSEKSQLNIRLPSEAEWLCLRDKISTDLDSWQQAPGNINLEYFASSCPVDRFENAGFFDITGNVWQWTESTIDGFNGFNVHPLYDDFSTPTFDGKHNLIKGGSWISTGNEAIKHSRYAFRRHFFQHAGFRYVESKSSDIPLLAENHYETSREVCQQLDSHYTSSYLDVTNYPQRIAKLVLQLVSKYKANKNKLLDLGCSVGRTSFELAGFFQHLDAVDFSARYIQHGVKMQQGKSVRYVMESEGELIDFKEVNLTKFDLSDDCKNINFSQGDACNLKAVFKNYDVILAQHILENSYDPALFLASIARRLNDNGLLILASDYRYNTDKTQQEKWLGGIKVNGENLTGFEGLSLKLSKEFDLLEQQEIPRILKTNQRNFTVSQSHITVWQLKN